MNAAMTATAIERAAAPVSKPTVALVVTTFNHARFLGDALHSITEQTRPPDEIIVVDDGSTDAPEEVIQGFAGVRFIRQANQGLSSARNAGLAAARSDFIAFLDADDLLLPRAIECGLAAHRDLPGAALVYGGHRRTDADGAPIGADRYDSVGRSAFRDLLRGNRIGMHGTVLFDRRMLLAAGGYDTSLRRCEDYDVYLRLARRHPIACYPEVVAAYRFHGGNMSDDRRAMLKSVLAVLDRHAEGLEGGEAAAAREGRRAWRDYYADPSFSDALESLRRGRGSRSIAALLFGLRLSPGTFIRVGGRRLRRVAGTMLPSKVKAWLRRHRGGSVPVGGWRMGDFARVQPASQDFGWDRGQPVDRYYIEGFLERCRSDIAGRVLEIGDDAYSRRFGGALVRQQDILHVKAGNPIATLVGDITDPAVLPSDAFDCIVLTQTLHLIYDLQAAVRNLYRSLRLGGVLLVTVPGISQIDRGEWGAGWCWSIMPAAATRLFGEVFDPASITVESRGNVYAATAMLEGLAQAEVDLRKLDIFDPAYPVIVTIRARKNAA
jgi:glycosyltransferase involved in cell wall biosynthesis